MKLHSVRFLPFFHTLKFTMIIITAGNITSVVQGAVSTSPPFTINDGVHQGSAISPPLIVLCMDTATADLQAPHPCSLLYADDVFLADKERQELQSQTQKWKIRLNEHGTWLNTKKTEYMEGGRQADGTITISGEGLEKVTQLKYLGSIISSSDGDTLQTPGLE